MRHFRHRKLLSDLEWVISPLQITACVSGHRKKSTVPLPMSEGRSFDFWARVANAGRTESERILHYRTTDIGKRGHQSSDVGSLAVRLWRRTTPMSEVSYRHRQSHTGIGRAVLLSEHADTISMSEELFRGRTSPPMVYEVLRC